MRCNNKLKFLVALLIVTTAFGIEWKMLGPNPHRSSSMIIDSINQRIILFGGTSEYTTGRWYNDVWEMPLDTTQRYSWHKVSVSGTPPTPRADHSSIFDSEHNRMLLFGGYGNQLFYNDVWALNLSLGNESWERLNPSGTPPVGRLNAHTIYHPLRNSLVTFGGGGYYTRYGDVWELKLDSMVWREISITGNRPESRGGGGEFFDLPNNRMIVFGGTSMSTFYNEVWALDLTLGNESWTQLYPTGSIPTGRDGFAYGYDPAVCRFYFFGGWDYDWNFYNDLHVLELNTLTWTQLYPTGDIPEERRNPTGVYDFFNDNFFVIGGDYGDGYYGETFFINLGSVGTPEWQAQPQANSYPALFVNSIASGSLRIHYTLPKICYMNIKILDSNGRVVSSLFSGKINSLDDWLYWNLKDDNNQNVSSGIYYCLLETEDTNISKKFVIAK